jgi:hypothetical protein
MDQAATLTIVIPAGVALAGIAGWVGYARGRRSQNKGSVVEPLRDDQSDKDM